jgi:hypothetical protein
MSGLLSVSGGTQQLRYERIIYSASSLPRYSNLNTLIQLGFPSLLVLVVRYRMRL